MTVATKTATQPDDHPTPTSHDPVICTQCGCLVSATSADQYSHQRWHRRIAALAERLAGIDDQLET